MNYFLRMGALLAAAFLALAAARAQPPVSYPATEGDYALRATSSSSLANSCRNFACTTGPSVSSRAMRKAGPRTRCANPARHWRLQPRQFLRPQFAGELFGPASFDINRYFILP
jgi:hypothetical protein